jgi:hypothetical protein
MSDRTPSETSAQRWAARAYAIVEDRGPDGLAELLADGFVQETHRGLPQEFKRDGLLGSVRSMREMDLHVSGFTVATAGDRCVLTSRSYHHTQTTVELLAVSVWNADGQLERLIEYDVTALDEAVAKLAEVSGQPVVRLA